VGRNDNYLTCRLRRKGPDIQSKAKPAVRRAFCTDTDALSTSAHRRYASIPSEISKESARTVTVAQDRMS